MYLKDEEIIQKAISAFLAEDTYFKGIQKLLERLRGDISGEYSSQLLKEKKVISDLKQLSEYIHEIEIIESNNQSLVPGVESILIKLNSKDIAKLSLKQIKRLIWDLRDYINDIKNNSIRFNNEIKNSLINIPEKLNKNEFSQALMEIDRLKKSVEAKTNWLDKLVSDLNQAKNIEKRLYREFSGMNYNEIENKIENLKLPAKLAYLSEALKRPKQLTNKTIQNIKSLFNQYLYEGIRKKEIDYNLLASYKNSFARDGWTLIGKAFEKFNNFGSAINCYTLAEDWKSIINMYKTNNSELSYILENYPQNLVNICNKAGYNGWEMVGNMAYEHLDNISLALDFYERGETWKKAADICMNKGYYGRAMTDYKKAGLDKKAGEACITWVKELLHDKRYDDAARAANEGGLNGWKMVGDYLVSKKQLMDSRYYYFQGELWEDEARVYEKLAEENKNNRNILLKNAIADYKLAGKNSDAKRCQKKIGLFRRIF